MAQTKRAAAGRVPGSRCELRRGPGSMWTLDEQGCPRRARSHLNYVVADTKRWEQQAVDVFERTANLSEHSNGPERERSERSERPYGNANAFSVPAAA